MYEIGDVVIDRTYNKNGVLAIVVGTGIQQPILLYHNRGIFYDELGDGFSTWDGLEMVGHIDFEKVWKEAVRIADHKTEPQTCSVNGRPYDCGNCEYHKCTADEPQTDCTDNCHKCNRIRECGYPLVGKCEYEPQTERPCDNCQEWDCYGCDYKQKERSK